MEQLKSPKFTDAGSWIPCAWEFGNSGEGERNWQTPAPSLATLRHLREDGFIWDEDAVYMFFDALLKEAFARRIAEGHKGLLKYAGTALAEGAIEAYCEACRLKRVFVEQPYSHVDEMIEPIIKEMFEKSRLKPYAATFFRYLAIVTFADPELTNNHPSFAVPFDNETNIENAFERASLEIQNGATKSPKLQFNQALDIISLYTKPSERIQYRPLESLLTAANRVMYVIEHRAY